MVFSPAFSWALYFLHVMIASGVIFEGVDMTAQTEAELAVAKAEQNMAFSGLLSIAGSGAFFNSLREDLSDFRWVTNTIKTEGCLYFVGTRPARAPKV